MILGVVLCVWGGGVDSILLNSEIRLVLWLCRCCLVIRTVLLSLVNRCLWPCLGLSLLADLDRTSVLSVCPPNPAGLM